MTCFNSSMYNVFIKDKAIVYWNDFFFLSGSAMTLRSDCRPLPSCLGSFRAQWTRSMTATVRVCFQLFWEGWTWDSVVSFSIRCWASGCAHIYILAIQLCSLFIILFSVLALVHVNFVGSRCILLYLIWCMWSNLIDSRRFSQKKLFDNLKNSFPMR